MAPPCPDAADRAAAAAWPSGSSPRTSSSLADRCLEADYPIQRRLYMPLILESLMHDLGKLINARALRHRVRRSPAVAVAT